MSLSYLDLVSRPLIGWLAVGNFVMSNGNVQWLMPHSKCNVPRCEVRNSVYNVKFIRFAITNRLSSLRDPSLIRNSERFYTDHPLRFVRRSVKATCCPNTHVALIISFDIVLVDECHFSVKHYYSNILKGRNEILETFQTVYLEKMSSGICITKIRIA